MGGGLWTIASQMILAQKLLEDDFVDFEGSCAHKSQLGGGRCVPEMNTCPKYSDGYQVSSVTEKLPFTRTRTFVGSFGKLQFASLSYDCL